jgi:CDP-diacylglycerol--glycerol-3-phosphate 3-phosphatidyltransferase
MRISDNLANYITLIRIFLTPVVVLTFIYDELPNAPYWTLAVFLIAALTDAVDGFVARLLKQDSDLGRFLDPMADKLLVTTTYIMVTIFSPELRKFLVPAVVVIISRDLFIVLFAYILTNITDGFLSPSKSSKATTFMQLTTLLLILIHRIYAENEVLILICNILLVITMILTLVSGVSYLLKARKKLKLAIPEKNDGAVK